MTDEQLVSVTGSLWEQSLGSSNGLHLTAGPVSGNNRIFFADTIERRAVVKWYFRGSVGSRNRMDSDWRMLKFADAAGISFTPTPYACDFQYGLVLMEWIEGEKISTERITHHEICAATEFLRQLNTHSARRYSAKLPEAAEACFTTLDHFEVMQRRLSRLSFIAESDVELKAIRLVCQMRNFWEKIRPSIAEDLRCLGVDPNMPIPRPLQCISPADFGFHNALRPLEGGHLRFFDFEYAGWDDPAKTLCDFFLAPSIPVPFDFWEQFTSQAFADWPNQAIIRQRANILFPLFSLKWCCIMLNAFVSDLASPGAFAASVHDLDQRKALQLYKAEHAFMGLLERTRVPIMSSKLRSSR